MRALCRRTRWAGLGLAVCGLVLAVGQAVASDSWPQFRGPRGDGTAEAPGLPLRWSEKENVVWRVLTVGRGRSSPVVLGDRIWLTTADETLPSPEIHAQKLINHPDRGAVYVGSRVAMGVICLDRASGKSRYLVELFRSDNPDPVHRHNSYATPTPVVEPGRLYCDFGTYGTACLEAETGKVLWKRQLPIEHLVGPASSPVLCGDSLILVRDGTDAQYVTALDKRTGKTVWQTNRPPLAVETGNEKKAFSTPLVIEHQGRKQIVVPGAQWVCSYDPATGRELWRVHHGRNFSLAPRPVYGDGVVYLSTGCPVAQLWAIRVDGQGDVTASHVLWRAKGQIPTMSSPLLLGTEIYCVSDGGVASCFEAASGKLLWRERIGENHAASPITGAGRIYFFSREGTTTVVQPGRQFKRLAENELEGPIVATPAVAGDRFYLRTDSYLYCLGRR